jgi:alpha-tubulin suppressor-like RCC1 family protein
MVLVACGWRHTITVSSSGSLYTYGWSKYGQLGHGDFEDHLVPHKVEALKDSSTSQVLANTNNILCYAMCMIISSCEPIAIAHRAGQGISRGNVVLLL